MILLFFYRENKLKNKTRSGVFLVWRFSGCFCFCFFLNCKLLREKRGSFGPVQMQYYSINSINEKYPQVG